MLDEAGNAAGRRECENGIVHRAEQVECVSALPRASNGVTDVSHGFCHADTDCGDGVEAFCGLTAIDGGSYPVASRFV